MTTLAICFMWKYNPPHVVLQSTSFNMISYILRPTEPGMILHLISNLIMGFLEKGWRHRGLLSNESVLNQGYVSFWNFSWYIFLSLNFLRAILRQNRFKYFALYFQREEILYSQFVLTDEPSRDLMNLLCSSKKYWILNLLRLHVVSIQAIYTVHHNTILV